MTDLKTNQEYVFKSIRQAKESELKLPSREVIGQILRGEKEQRKDYYMEFLY